MAVTGQVARILGLARPELGALGLGTVFLAVSSLATLAYPKAVERIVDEALGSRSAAAVDQAAGIMVVLFAVQAVASGLRFLLFSRSGERVVTRLRRSLFDRLLDQEIAFFDQTRTGELLSRLSSDTQILQNAVSVNVSMLLRNVASALGAVVLLFIISPKLTGLMLLVVPPISVAAVGYGRRVRRLSKEAQDALADASQVAEAAFSGVRTVRAFAQEPREQRRYRVAVEAALDAATRRIQHVAAFSGGASFLGGTSVAAVLWFGGRMVVGGELSTGELTAFLLYTVIVAFSVGALADLWGDFMRAAGAAERVFALLDREPAIPPRAPGLRPERIEGRVKLDGVRFSYPSRPDVDVLRGLDLDIHPGERLALVGPSGAGKSTIAGLLLRFYDPTGGAVLLDGVDLRELDPEVLREKTAIVSQEPTLVSATIAENIRYGRPDATDEEVEAAAAVAHADAFIRAFPDGYATTVGERGVQLSGGQKQRVAIARALLRDPRVLILDEATSALDAESEHWVQMALERLMEGRTTVIIAHRLSTVQRADRVAVIGAGQVIEIGPHRVLVEADGPYRRLVERQFAAESEPPLIVA